MVVQVSLVKKCWGGLVELVKECISSSSSRRCAQSRASSLLRCTVSIFYTFTLQCIHSIWNFGTFSIGKSEAILPPSSVNFWAVH